jgi:hypothetical protein
MSHLRNTWKTAAVMREYRRPITALFTSQKLRTRIWIMRNTAIGMSDARRAAAQMGTQMQVSYEFKEIQGTTYDFVAQWVSKLRVDNLSILEVDWKRA